MAKVGDKVNLLGKRRKGKQLGKNGTRERQIDGTRESNSKEDGDKEGEQATKKMRHGKKLLSGETAG